MMEQDAARVVHEGNDRALRLQFRRLNARAGERVLAQHSGDVLVPRLCVLHGHMQHAILRHGFAVVVLDVEMLLVGQPHQRESISDILRHPSEVGIEALAQHEVPGRDEGTQVGDCQVWHWLSRADEVGKICREIEVHMRCRPVFAIIGEKSRAEFTGYVSSVGALEQSEVADALSPVHRL